MAIEVRAKRAGGAYEDLGGHALDGLPLDLDTLGLGGHLGEAQRRR